MVAILGAGSLFGLTGISQVLRMIEGDIKGRLVVFFPGHFERNNYRLLDARDGWNYLAVPIGAQRMGNRMKIKDTLQRDPAVHPLVNQGQARISDSRNERAQAELRGELETFVCEGQYAEGIQKIVRSGAFGKTDHGALWIDHTIAALETRERGTIRTIDWSLRLGPVLARAREKRYQIGTLLFVPQRRHTHARAGNNRLGSAM